MSERINIVLSDDMRDKFEAWRARQYEVSGRIPSLTEGLRMLIQEALEKDGGEHR